VRPRPVVSRSAALGLNQLADEVVVDRLLVHHAEQRPHSLGGLVRDLVAKVSRGLAARHLEHQGLRGEMLKVHRGEGELGVAGDGRDAVHEPEGLEHLGLAGGFGGGLLDHGLEALDLVVELPVLSLESLVLGLHLAETLAVLGLNVLELLDDVSLALLDVLGGLASDGVEHVLALAVEVGMGEGLNRVAIGNRR